MCRKRKAVKVLWLCNIVLPDFSQEFGIKRSNAGGWMTGMLHQLEKMDGIEIGLIFPIIDSNRLRDGIYNGHEYYTFLCDFNKETCDEKTINRFYEIIKKFSPDILHIWGTEYSHTTSMLIACKNNGLLDKVVVHIQGLVSVCSMHYLAGIPEEYRKVKIGNTPSLEDDKLLFENHGKSERQSIEMARHVIGRTDWDRACVESISTGTHYYFCGEILRDIFYVYKGEWEYGKCKKYSIFMSQASYPIKGLHYLLQALPYIVNKYPSVHIYIAGKDILGEEQRGAYAVYIDQLMKKLRIKEHVSYLGSLDEKKMIQQYLACNVFALTSTVENSPNSLSEAMLLGVPCVASYVGGVGNIIDFGKNGFLYPYDEPALLAYYICKIFENSDDLCDRFSNDATDKISKMADPEINATRNIDIYRNILDNGCF